MTLYTRGRRTVCDPVNGCLNQTISRPAGLLQRHFDAGWIPDITSAINTTVVDTSLKPISSPVMSAAIPSIDPNMISSALSPITQTVKDSLDLTKPKSNKTLIIAGLLIGVFIIGKVV